GLAEQHGRPALLPLPPVPGRQRGSGGHGGRAEGRRHARLGGLRSAGCRPFQRSDSSRLSGKDATMTNFVERFGPWALVTGASSGIGEAFARRLAGVGMNLVLVARREDRLRKLAEDLQSQHSVSTRVVPVDLSQDNFLSVIEQATADVAVGLLVNNA